MFFFSFLFFNPRLLLCSISRTVIHSNSSSAPLTRSVRAHMRKSVVGACAVPPLCRSPAAPLPLLRPLPLRSVAGDAVRCAPLVRLYVRPQPAAPETGVE